VSAPDWAKCAVVETGKEPVFYRTLGEARKEATARAKAYAEQGYTVTGTAAKRIGGYLISNENERFAIVIRERPAKVNKS
jgi:hypothetical protein